MGWFTSEPEIPIYEDLKTPEQLEEYRSLGEGSTEKLSQLCNETEGWEPLVHDYPNISLHSKIVGNSPIEMTKATGVIKAKIEDIVKSIMPVTEEEMKKSDEEILEWSILKNVADDLEVVYSAHSAPFPVSSRELIYLRHSRTLENGNFIVSASSINVKDQPIREKRVRAAIYYSGWVVEKIDDDSCKVTRILQLDPKGNIPTMIVNAYKTKTALAVNKLRSVFEG